VKDSYASFVFTLNPSIATHEIEIIEYKIFDLLRDYGSVQYIVLFICKFIMTSISEHSF
jgi:hypothetical protein